MAAKKRGLGRNLNALLGNNTPAAQPQKAAVSSDNNTLEVSADKPQETDSLGAKDKVLRDLPVDVIQRGKYQPRRDMHSEALEELADSIKAQGVMQPIVVRPVSADKYEIIAGERRWRASQIAGLDVIPAIIRDVPDEAAVAMALIENIQREDLNAMEEALAMSRLQQEFELTHQEVADAVGKSRSAVSNLLRLMSLREEVQRMLEHGDLEMGHARAILALPVEQQTSVANQVVSRGLSVRQAEALIRKLLNDADKPQTSSKPVDPDVQQLENDLSERVGVPVMLQHSAKGKGKLVLKYNNLDELDGILSHIK